MISFEPLATGNLTATLTLTSNDPDESTLIITLVGSAVEPNLVVDLTLTDATVVNALDPTLAFGQQVNDGTGGEVDRFPINLVNTGSSALTISSITFSQTESPFSIEGAATDGFDHSGR